MKWLLCLLPFTLAAQPITIEANRASYQGGQLLLRGQVHLEHPLVEVRADEARIEPSEDQALGPFELHDRVHVSFRDGGELHCCHAFVDPSNRQGRFLEAVRYNDTTPARERPIAIACGKMDVQLADDGDVNELTADQRVEIVHAHNFRASAHSAKYFKADPLAALPADLAERYSETPCDALILQESVALSAHKLGELTTDEQVWLIRTLRDGKADVDCFHASGNIALISSEGGRLLQCRGTLFVDQQSATALLQSDEGVLYRDPLGGFVADSISVEYSPAEDGFEASRIALVGNVRIQGNADLGEETSLHYAIADEVEYLPPSETMTLRAFEGSRVLFLDQGEDTRISAKEVVINRHDKSIEGVGNVRFSLSDNEMSKLQQLFAFEG